MTKNSSSHIIGTLNQGSLHAGIKEWYSEPEDFIEEKVDSYIIDIIRNELLIEIQTTNFSAIKKKLKELSEKYQVLLLHPIASEKWIVNLSKNKKKVLSRRKSPKRGTVYHLFSELVRIPTLINNPNFSIEVLITKEEEYRCKDGKGSWRRKGQSIVDKKLLEVVETIRINTLHDILCYLPDNLEEPFTCKDIASELRLPVYIIRQMVYCLKKMEALKEVGRKKDGILYERLI